MNNREMNEVHMLLSDGGHHLHLGVNSEWPSSKAVILISDNEPGLANAVNAERRQPAYSMLSSTVALKSY